MNQRRLQTTYPFESRGDQSATVRRRAINPAGVVLSILHRFSKAPILLVPF
jgi:hypothetical protein